MEELGTWQEDFLTHDLILINFKMQDCKTFKTNMEYFLERIAKSLYSESEIGHQSSGIVFPKGGRVSSLEISCSRAQKTYMVAFGHNYQRSFPDIFKAAAC